ncbi:MAG TPA: hypothetical protein VEY12_00665 [Thermoplasmata archaeon]|nr:hypothetical protein [Thermoplasmata archaeon]
MPQAGRVWDDFSYVASSSYRERVLNSLASKPKFPSQLGEETRLRIVHVSRALREMRKRGLVECLNPEVKARGRLYALTPDGATVLGYMGHSKERFVPAAPNGRPYTGFVPKIRGSSVRRFLAVLREMQGSAPVDEALHAWSLDPAKIEEDTWLPVDAAAELLELVETRFGDGTYAFIRSVFRESVASFPTIREQLAQALPLERLAEHAPAVYSKEWNFGRMEVEVHPRRTIMRHYDWLPTPAMCSMFLGIYEGILKSRGFQGRVANPRCVRRGDPCCEYVAEW